MGKKILVVDDEPSIVSLLEYNLSKEGFDVIVGTNGIEAMELIEKENPSLMILDIMLPGLNGLEVCRESRQKGFQLPILMLTAKDDEIDKVIGLELGADGYMTKPFSPREVVARVKAILRRVDHVMDANKSGNNFIVKKIVIENMELYPDMYEAYYLKKKIPLTPKEFMLLLYFVEHKGRVVTREQLLNVGWNSDYERISRVVDVHVSHLREKIKTYSKSHEFITTVYGVGYKFEEPRSNKVSGEK